MPENVRKDIETLEALEAVLDLLAKKEAQLAELSKEIERLKDENAKYKIKIPQSEEQYDSSFSSSSEDEVGGKRAFIVDHIKMFRTTLNALLIDNGVKVVGQSESPDISAILEEMRLAQPSIVTMDFHMPGLDGIQLVKSIKSQSPHIKIIVISSELSPEAIYSLLRAGVSDFVTKPIQQTRFTNVLKGLYSK